MKNTKQDKLDKLCRQIVDLTNAYRSAIEHEVNALLKQAGRNEKYYEASEIIKSMQQDRANKQPFMYTGFVTLAFMVANEYTYIRELKKKIEVLTAEVYELSENK